MRDDLDLFRPIGDENHASSPLVAYQEVVTIPASAFGYASVEHAVADLGDTAAQVPSLGELVS